MSPGKWLRAVIFAAGVAVIVVTATPLVRWWGHALEGQWAETRGGQILIVPGADLTAPGVPGPTSYWRSFYAVLEWRSGHYRKIVICGRGVSPAMRDFVVASGVPKDAVITEERSTSTRENALFVASLLRGDPGPDVLLSSDYHMFRAVRAFRRAGLQVIPEPFPDAQKRANSVPERWTVFCVLVGETAKIGYYKVRGWL